MKTLVRIALFGLFGAAGIGLAICVGFSTDAPADGRLVQPPGHEAGLSPNPVIGQSPEVAVEDRPGPAVTDRKERGKGLLLPPIPSAERLAPWPPPAAASGGPLLVEPYPAHTQQLVPEMSQRHLQQVYDLLRPHLTSQPAGPASTADAAAPVGAVGQPLAAPAGEAFSASPEPTAEGSVDGEEDGLWSINFPNNDIREVLEMLSARGNLNILASSNVQGQVSATLNGVDIDSALHAILRSTGFIAKREGKFIYVGTPEDFEAMEHLLDTVGTRVYRPNYVTAAELNTLITPLLTATVSAASVTSPSEMGIASDSSEAGGDAFAGGEALVVRDYEAVLAEIDQVVAEIDVRPLQVHIETMILSIKLSDSNKFGVNFELLRQNNLLKLGSGTVPNAKPLAETVLNDAVDMAKAAAVDGLTRVTLDGGLKFGFLDSNLALFLDALETIGDANVIATPRLLVINKQRAEIHIGAEHGYISTTVTENSATQTVEFLNVGALLRLRPFISSDGMIRMEVHPELSTGEVKVEGGFTLPDKETTQVTTNIMVRDGCTVVIGGLMRDELETSTSQVPLLGSLPVVGVLFRSKTEKIRRREVMILITPHIVYEPDTCREGEKVAGEFHRRHAVYGNKMSPLIGKRAIGLRYFRHAQNAWAAGDQDGALRFVEMSIHFDPLSRAAIDLRSDIWLGRPFGDHALNVDLPPAALQGTTPGPMDGSTISPWLLDNLEQRQPIEAPPLHPLDPGQPGSRANVVRPRKMP